MFPYLKPADIPESGDKEYIPTTYGDMDMIFYPFRCAISLFLYQST